MWVMVELGFMIGFVLGIMVWLGFMVLFVINLGLIVWLHSCC